MNLVNSEWNKLSTAKQNEYLADAPAEAKKLVKNGQLIYNIAKQKYNAVISQQGISDATTSTSSTTSSSSSSSGSSGSGGY